MMALAVEGAMSVCSLRKRVKSAMPAVMGMDG